MNDKIEELAEQAGIKHRLDIPTEICGYDKDLEKFAELIIEECAIAYHKTRLSDTSITNHFRSHLGIGE